ncbi:MAG: aminoacyl-tRNA hydrolase [Microbacteriaceae bacterium]|nr:aminoacyl-tRNA hydrolase [Microbacteriaceae bacterium]
MQETWLIAGLGNPGPRYETTRHNIGQMALDVLATDLNAKYATHKSNCRIAEARLRPGGPKVVLAKPNSYMNLSGGPVLNAMKYFDIPSERLIVLHDELDIPFDTIRLKTGGGHGGHNGLRDIAKSLGTPDFLRVRIGIGRPPGSQDVADFVLSPFSSTERKTLEVLVSEAAEAATQIIDNGLVAAQQRYHARG